MMALVCGGTLNSSAANLSTAVKGAASGTLNLREFKAGGVAPDQDQQRCDGWMDMNQIRGSESLLLTL